MKFNVTVLALVGIVALAKAGHINELLPDYVKSLAQLDSSPALTSPDNGKGVEIRWMLQRLEHFDKRNKKAWRMRYMVNEEHFEAGGPMFILVGGYAPISAIDIQSGIFYDLAKEHKAMLFHTEHRYYGESNPFSNLTIQNLKYLHSKQALVDLVHFIRTQRDIYPQLENSKVIMAGASYAGSLVVWFSKLYPEFVTGGWASSAPILAQVDFKEYNEMSGKAYRELGSQECYNRIQNGIAELEAMFADDRWAEAKAMLLLCDSFNHRNDLDLWSLFYMVVDSFTKDVLYQKGIDIYGACNYLMSFEDDLTAVIAVFIVNNFFGQDCVDATYRHMFNTFMNLSAQPENPRPWFYQLCNEFGWFQTTTSRQQPFGTKVPPTLLLAMCYDVFGPLKYTSDHIHALVGETNYFFGGMKPGVKNVYMTYGALDPWSPLGLRKSRGASVIPGASHCSDLNSISSFDSPEMRISKQHLANLVREWLA